MEHPTMSLILAERPAKTAEVPDERMNARGNEMDRPVKEECARAFLIGVLLPASWSEPIELPA